MNISRLILVLIALSLVACATTPVTCGSFLCQQSDPVVVGNIPVSTKPAKINMTDAPTQKPGGYQITTPPATRALGVGQVTRLPTLVPQPSPTAVLDSAKKKTDGEKKLEEIFRELNLRGKEYRVKTLDNGVIVIPDDGSNDSVLIKSLLTAAQRDNQETMVEIQPDDMTDPLIQHMPLEGNQFFIGVNDEPTKSLVSGQLKVRDGSTVVYVEMYPAKLIKSNLGVDRTLLVTPDPGGPFAIYVELMASLLEKDGMGKILLQPDFAYGLRLSMPTATWHVIDIAKTFGATYMGTEYLSAKDLELKYPGRYASPILDAFERTDDREIFRLITITKK